MHFNLNKFEGFKNHMTTSFCLSIFKFFDLFESFRIYSSLIQTMKIMMKSDNFLFWCQEQVQHCYLIGSLRKLAIKNYPTNKLTDSDGKYFENLLEDPTLIEGLRRTLDVEVTEDLPSENSMMTQKILLNDNTKHHKLEWRGKSTLIIRNVNLLG